MKLQLRIATPLDGDYLAVRLCEADIEEYMAATGKMPHNGLADDISQCEHVYVITIKETGEPIAILGCDDWCGTSGAVGGVWLLATEQLKDYAAEFLRNSHTIVNALHNRWPVLANYTYARNKQHHKLLRFCGFHINENPIPWGVGDSEFYFFMKHKEE